MYANENYEIPVIISFIIAAIQIVPSLALQYNYYKVDQFKNLIIDDLTNKVTIIDAEKEFTFRLDDIDRIRMVHSKRLGESYGKEMAWQPHYYYMICPKNDDEYLVTRLVVRKLEKIINVRIVYKRVFFPFITKEVLKKAKNG